MTQETYDYFSYNAKFEKFVVNNAQKLADMPYNEIINITKVDKISNLLPFTPGLEEKPTNIVYVGKLNIGTTDVYNFLSRNMNKAYVYYDKRED